MSEKPATTQRRPRADALRNRQKIMAAAVAALEQDGATFSMDAIAKAAGVGTGTLYRNFATREELIAAALNEQGLCPPQISEETLASGRDSLAAIEEWLRTLGTWFTTYEGLTDPLRAAVDSYNSPFSMQCQDVIAQLDALIAPAQKDGLIREGVTGRDLYMATLGMAWAAQHTDAPGTLHTLLAQGWRTH